MTAKDNPSGRGITAIVVATAAVTLAIGVTVAALGGYLAPLPGSLSEQVTPLESPIDVVDSNTGSPAVVLVPVTAQPPVEPSRGLQPGWAEPEPILAAQVPARYEDDDDEDHEHRARGHRGRAPDGDDEHDEHDEEDEEDEHEDHDD
jgi:hypothetical protein